MRTTYFSVADGHAVEESEALRNGVLRSGYGARNHAMLRDSAQDDNGQGAYEAWIGDAWKSREHFSWNPGDVQPAPARLEKDANGQADYERRISDAWKGQAHV